ncbi:MAG TPA: hypothetical protein VNC40_08505 [Gaiellaceae bacterium]|nr:hypothetical protein [Gaiellaceae bacterium]
MAQASRQPAASRVSGLLASPRNQRRLLWLSGGVLLAGIAAFVSLVLMRGTGNSFPDTISNKPATLYHPEKTVPVTKEQIGLARRFIETAVARKNLDVAYTLVHADLKGALTRRQWDTGNIPVITYEAQNAQTAAFTVDYSYATSALLEVDLVARPHTETRPHLLFYLGLKRASKNAPWLVNYWQPHWRPPVPMAVH